MKILFLTPAPKPGASSRYRVYQYIKYLENEFECEVHPAVTARAFSSLNPSRGSLRRYLYFGCAVFGRLRSVLSLTRYDFVFIQRLVLPHIYPFSELCICKIAHKLGKKVVFDFDDAIFTVPPQARKSIFYHFRDSKKAARVIASVDHVIAGNGFLAEYAERFNKNVSVIPTSIELDHYSLKTKNDNNEHSIVIGWIGSQSSLCYMEILKGVFRRLSQKYDIIVRLIGAEGYDIPGVRVEYREWSLESEVKQIQSFTIGVSPLTDDDYARGKCGLKLLQYMAAGVPAVASPVGVHKEIISDGINGFLANSREEWVKKIERLILEPDLRRSFAENGRKTVEQGFSTKINVQKLIKVFEELQ